MLKIIGSPDMPAFGKNDGNSEVIRFNINRDINELKKN